MRSWLSPKLPDVPGQGRVLRLYDAATGQVRPTTANGRATMYVCGITPYDATHVGHAATYITFDLINRLWRDAGETVHYAQNVTDVDDPLLERAAANGQDWRAVAERETQIYRDDMAALRVLAPDHLIGAVESIPATVQTIAELQTAGSVYGVDSDRYYSIKSNRRFGQIANLPTERMLALFAERGGDPDRLGKRNPLDPLLWQAARDGEPSWQSELGHGRPGWHVECAAIATEYLGMPIDLQGGGSDLAFPHHEMTSAIAQSAQGEWPFARHTVHTGMVAYQGEKMSKSLGNLVFVRNLREAGHDPSVIRLALLAHHYRSDWEWTHSDIERAQTRFDLWRSAAAKQTAPSAKHVIDRVREVLVDDLNTTGALRAIDDWAQDAVNGLGDDPHAAGHVVALVDALLGVGLRG